MKAGIKQLGGNIICIPNKMLYLRKPIKRRCIIITLEIRIVLMTQIDYFAEGEGFKQEVAANVGCRKGSDKLLKLIDKTLKGVSQEERDQMWDACLDRQPA